MCGDFAQNIVLEDNLGCCGIPCLVQKGIEAKQAMDAEANRAPSPPLDRSKPAIPRQNAYSPAYEAELVKQKKE